MRSMLLALSLFDCDVVAVSPPDRRFSRTYLAAYERSGRTLSLAESAEELLPRVDVLYLGSAIQQPDFSAGHDAAVVKPATPERYRVSLGKLRRLAPAHLAVLHTLTRGDELCPDVDASPYNAYWAEAANAVTVAPPGRGLTCRPRGRPRSSASARTGRCWSAATSNCVTWRETARWTLTAR